MTQQADSTVATLSPTRTQSTLALACRAGPDSATSRSLPPASTYRHRGPMRGRRGQVSVDVHDAADEAHMPTLDSAGGQAPTGPARRSSSDTRSPCRRGERLVRRRVLRTPEASAPPDSSSWLGPGRSPPGPGFHEASCCPWPVSPRRLNSQVLHHRLAAVARAGFTGWRRIVLSWAGWVRRASLR